MSRVAAVLFLLGLLTAGNPVLAQDAMQKDGMTKDSMTTDSMGHDGMQK
jgi:pentapeptide MXKDX repeat protein